MNTFDGFFADEYGTVYKFDEQAGANVAYGKLNNESLEDWVEDYYMSDYK